jgi:glutaredoxin 3
MSKIKIYSKDPCPYCVNAKRLLDNKGLSYDLIDMTDNLDELNQIKDQWGWKTVPIIIINDKLVGGYTDLKMLNETGELDKMLK